MYVKKRVSLWRVISWSKWPFIIGVIYSGTLCFISYLLEFKMSIPWSPLGLIGIAVAFYLGFKNNSSYDRIWEARKIWGSIVNNSRTFSAPVVSFVQGDNQDEIKKELIYRHIAWITALRHQLRVSRPWEHINDRLNGLYAPTISEDYNTKLDTELALYISEKELNDIKNNSNKATQILKLQSQRLQGLRDMNYFEDFRQMELHQLITSFYEDQGKSERIKNFPLPRQYTSIGEWITLVFCTLVPFGLMDVMSEKEVWIWLCPVLSALVIWVFILMEKIGNSSENPFEGTYNDVPITAISRTIEIDIREMINDKDIPDPIEADKNGFLM
ncbi:bestrophin family protein [Aquimarina rhabdastrellae]